MTGRLDTSGLGPRNRRPSASARVRRRARGGAERDYDEGFGVGALDVVNGLMASRTSELSIRHGAADLYCGCRDDAKSVAGRNNQDGT